MQDFSHQLQTAVNLARQAGRLIWKIYSTDFSVAFKGKSDPVTEADRRANDLIVEGLQRKFPQDLIIAEESPLPQDPPHTDFVWYIDPLDGTKEFIAKNGEFSVMIGLALKGKACLGVVYRPDKDILYMGISEQQSWIEFAGEKKPIQTNSHTNPQDLSLVVSRSHRHASMEEIKTAIGLHHEIISGSVGLKIGLIANGQAEVYIEPGSYTSAWDACAPEAILRGAGGRFSDIFGNSIHYHPTNLKNKDGLVGTNGKCHDRILQAISPLVGRGES